MGAVRSRLGPSGQVPHDERMRSRAASTLVFASSHVRRSSWSLAMSQRCPVARSIEARAWQADRQSLRDASRSRSARDSSVRDARNAAPTPRSSPGVGPGSERGAGGGGGGGCAAGLSVTSIRGVNDGWATDSGALLAAPAAADGGEGSALGDAGAGSLPPHAVWSAAQTTAMAPCVMMRFVFNGWLRGKGFCS
jgi:hypothetical protein